ncbi:Asp-tRNA(Asn)/Glu-tRNA(Gln) amidotransferase subunit GatA [Chlamydiifrater phoenicopteri]|uniref:Asp-tRNA(Asn)/Glu-tRNA(Gln) amidotransferase subunit GatA n=1 Tax=Chlamydiifrater phoenicopteri TaxID=2681469 RepID=UPI001BCA735F|nr:Asp-tRNA(Asn)/Glu-tRNA(Gln) amidotransferase subunit GatA [Chlamydiifrater phoenicopteri]
MYKKTAIELKESFLQKEVSAVEIVEYFFDRVYRFDDQVQAFLHLCKDRALKKAAELDEKRAQGALLGKMAGIPVGVKDNIHIKGLPTTCASKMLEGYQAPFSATVIGALEKEDAIILGKLNMDEFAMGSSTAYSAFHPTKNPWDLDRVPGGSSGGSAAAVSARLCPIALGSDTGGSIRQPASFCGVVGFNPSYGTVSRYGLVAFASSLDRIGPLGNTVEDVALAMDVIAGRDEKDATSRDVFADGKSFSESIKRIEVPNLIGVPTSFLKDLSEDSKENFYAALEVFTKEGARVVEVDLDMLRHAVSVYYVVASAEAATNLARFDGVRYGHRCKEAKTLKDMLERSREEGFGQEVTRRILLGNYVLSSSKRKEYYGKAEALREGICRAFRKAFEVCDFIATPVCTGPAFKSGAVLDPVSLYLQDIYTVAVNLAYLPAISVPSGFSSQEKLPLGLQLIGAVGSDKELCQAAYTFQELSKLKNCCPEPFAVA